MNKYLAYIDESGDPIFNDKASKTFLVAAILIPQANLESIKEVIRDIYLKFGLTELKSSQISNFNRRYKICEILSGLDIKIVTVRVDKAALCGDWFRYRGSFYKHIQYQLHREICRLYNPEKFVIDRYGSPEYQKSFRTYLENKLQKELFDPFVHIGSAKESEFIQISDFIAGSIRKAVDGDFPEGKNILDLFDHKWPIKRVIPDGGRYIKPIPNEDDAKEVIIFLEEVRRYLESDTENIISPKIRTLEYLYYSAIDGRNEWLLTNEILDWLGVLGLSVSEEQFRAEIMGVLRDEGLVIVSSRKGIKIPLNIEDIKEYMQFSVNFALPVLKRLKKAVTFIEEKSIFPEIGESLSDEMQNILKAVSD